MFKNCFSKVPCTSFLSDYSTWSSCKISIHESSRYQFLDVWLCCFRSDIEVKWSISPRKEIPYGNFIYVTFVCLWYHIIMSNLNSYEEVSVSLIKKESFAGLKYACWKFHIYIYIYTQVLSDNGTLQSWKITKIPDQYAISKYLIGLCWAWNLGKLARIAYSDILR